MDPTALPVYPKLISASALMQMWASCPERGPAPQIPAAWRTHTLTYVTPSRSPRIHCHNHSLLELEGQSGSAMVHLNPNIPFTIPTKGLEEFPGLIREKR